MFWYPSRRVQEMQHKMGHAELDAKVKFGSIIKELDPDAAPEDKIFRYRDKVVGGESSDSVTKKKEGTEEALGDQVHR